MRIGRNNVIQVDSTSVLSHELETGKVLANDPTDKDDTGKDEVKVDEDVQPLEEENADGQAGKDDTDKADAEPPVEAKPKSGRGRKTNETNA